MPAATSPPYRRMSPASSRRSWSADNQYVRAGQLLIRLDERDFRAAVDRAAAIVEERQATLAGLERKQTLQQSAIRQAEADLDAKTARATFAKQDAHAIATWR